MSGLNLILNETCLLKKRTKRKKKILYSYKLTVSVHSNFETFLQSAGLTLVTPRDVNGAGIAFFALISQVSSNASLEKASATITCQHAVMLSRSSVSTNFAQDSLLDFCKWKI